MLGWGLVAAYEAYAIARRKQTMSAAFQTFRRSRLGYWAALAAWTVLTIHLFPRIAQEVADVAEALSN